MEQEEETMKLGSRKAAQVAVVGLLVGAVGLIGARCELGLSPQAYLELHAAGVDKYLGQFTPAVSEELGGGWTKHTFDPDGGDGPLCIAGTPFTAFTKPANPSRVMIFLQGGGACWQDFYFCNILADAAPPPLAGPHSGIWVDSFDTGSGVVDNPLADWSVVYASYCDGSVFGGDNDVVDPSFPFGPVRHHRGLRNLSAVMDLAKAEFPHASRVLVAGTSAGGVGSAAFAPFLARFEYGNTVQLLVFNDAGPVVVNTDETAAIQARANDWQFGQFYPASCTDCDVEGQAITEIIKWRLANDGSVREAFYSTDGDATARFFLNVPTQEQYRELMLAEQDLIHDAYPNRYRRFIRSGSVEHTALQLPSFYLGEANGVPLHEWTGDFLVPVRPFWVDLVEDFVPAP
jgi:hypothetical protein